MNWLEQEEFNKKQRETRYSNIEDQKKIDEGLIVEKLKINLELGLKIQNRINDVSTTNKSSIYTPNPKIMGGFYGTWASFESSDYRVVKKLSNEKYNFKKRRLTINTNYLNLNKSQWHFIEEYFNSTSYTTNNWPLFDTTDNYVKKLEEKILFKRDMEIERIGKYNEDFWLNIFDWLLLKTDQIILI
jgi:hypothetical protein